MFIERQPDDSWKSFGWQEANLTGAIHWVKGRLGNDTFARSVKFSCHTEQYNATLAVAPEAMVKGLFASDPNLALVQAVQQPEEVVEFLVDSGYKASPALSPKLSRNDGQAFLNNLGGFAANQAEYSLFPMAARRPPGLTPFEIWFWCSCTTASFTITLQPPDPEIVENHYERNGYCVYTYKRRIGYTLTYTVGLTGISCANCGSAAPSSTDLFEVTTVEFPGPCPPSPGPGTVPGQPWAPWAGVATTCP